MVVDQYNWEQLTSQQTLAAIAQVAMEESPASRKKIAEVFEVLSSTLANLQGTTDELREQHNVLMDSYRDIAACSHHYHHVFEQSPHSLIMTDGEGTIQDLSWAAITLLGQPPDPLEPSNPVGRSNLLGQSLLSFISPESIPTLTQYLRNIRQFTPGRQGSCQPVQVWIEPLLGEQRWVEVSAQCFSATDEACQGLSWSLTDMTESRQLEVGLRNEIQDIHKRYADIQETNQALEKAVQAKNSQVLKATEFESTLKRITDKVRDSLDESKILQTVVKELSIVLRLGGCNTALYDLEKGTSTISYEYTNFISAYRGKVAQMDNFPEIYNQLKQGHYFQFCSLIPNPERGHVSLLACPIFVDAEQEDMPNDSPSHAFELDQGQGKGDAVAREEVLGDLWLIDRKEHVFNEFEIRLVQQVANQCAIAIRQARLYKAAQAQVHELEKLNRLKDEFLSTVSHELRTPISNVKMAIHMLKNAPTEEKRQQYLKILESESQREADLIDDLLDLQKLEVSTYPMAAKTLQVRPWVESITQPFQSRLESHQQILSMKCSKSVHTLRTDFSILERIIAELLNNACKYTPSGHQILVEVYAEEQIEQNELLPSSVIFKVSNQADISAEELPHIFDKFYRIPHSDPWKQGGTGLGLALVQKLVEQIQGTISVSSADGWTHFMIMVAHHS